MRPETLSTLFSLATAFTPGETRSCRQPPLQPQIATPSRRLRKNAFLARILRFVRKGMVAGDEFLRERLFHADKY
jgi:hypothetical protein